jgi:hypothetical protein
MRSVIRLSISLGIALAFLVPAVAAADDMDGSRGVIVRVNGDVVVDSGDTADIVVVVDGNLDQLGRSEGTVIVNGTANLTGASAEWIVAVNSTVNLSGGTVVEGDITNIESTINRADATVNGEIRDVDPAEIGLWLTPVFALFSIVFLIGGALMIIVFGLLAAAIAPTAIRRTGWLINADPGNVVLAGLAFWLGLPFLAIVSIITLVGMPLGFAILFGVLPTVGFLGAIVGGIRLGDWLVAQLRGQVEQDRPYLASFLGLGLLVLIGLIPVVGGLAWLVASFLGTGAITLAAWRSMRGRPTFATAPVPATAGAMPGWTPPQSPAPPPSAAPPPGPAAYPEPAQAPPASAPPAAGEPPAAQAPDEGGPSQT